VRVEELQEFRLHGPRHLPDLIEEEGSPVRLGEETVAELTPAEARRRIDDGTIAGGMALKVRVALEASAAGIPEVVIAGKARLLGTFPGTRLVPDDETTREVTR
jgi:hypothetical protein